VFAPPAATAEVEVLVEPPAAPAAPAAAAPSAAAAAAQPSRHSYVHGCNFTACRLGAVHVMAAHASMLGFQGRLQQMSLDLIAAKTVTCRPPGTRLEPVCQATESSSTNKAHRWCLCWRCLRPRRLRPQLLLQGLPRRRCWCCCCWGCWGTPCQGPFSRGPGGQEGPAACAPGPPGRQPLGLQLMQCQQNLSIVTRCRNGLLYYCSGGLSGSCQDLEVPTTDSSGIGCPWFVAFANIISLEETRALPRALRELSGQQGYEPG
jgi:hypothetical protein